MTVIRVSYLPKFHLGDDAVVLTLDGGGTDTIRAVVTEARQNGSSRFVHDGVTQEFVIAPGAAAIELSETRVVWRLDPAKAAEIADDLAALSTPRDDGKTAGHFYVDMTTLAETLVISRDEYTDVAFPWISPE